jgi:hypothetical protein
MYIAPSAWTTSDKDTENDVDGGDKRYGKEKIQRHHGVAPREKMQGPALP